MPIRPDMRARYPENWAEISLRIRERAGWRCEGSPLYPDCWAINARLHPVTGSVVVLTVARLNHTPEDCRDENLKAWCQRCHLAYDAPEHRRNAWRTRHERRAMRDLFDALEA